MSCTRPITAWVRGIKENGKRDLVLEKYKADINRYFDKKTNMYLYERLELPCSRCESCKMKKARDWACRCTLEKGGLFITLTYDTENCPKDYKVNMKHMTDFIKRLRDKLGYPELKYFGAGEQGEKKGRPHYHLILWLDDESTKRLAKKWEYTNNKGHMFYTSKLITETWGKGIALITDASQETNFYVASYTQKKGSNSNLRMSKGLGLKDDWLKFYKNDKIVTTGGHVQKPPRYFDKKLEETEPEKYRKIKENRRKVADMKQQTEEYITSTTRKRLLEIQEKELKKKLKKAKKRL